MVIATILSLAKLWPNEINKFKQTLQLQTVIHHYAADYAADYVDHNN